MLVKKIPLGLVSLTLFSFVVFAGTNSEVGLKIGDKNFTISELLKSPDLENIVLKNVPAYPGKEMHFKAIKAAKLFEGANIRDDDVIQFRCTDGFSNVISKERILASDKNHSIAYVAIEDPKAKWPALRGNAESGSAGPFYLVWENPELSRIVEDEWPFKVVAFEVKGKLQELYPKIFPRHPNVHAQNGFKLFQKTCFACHKINGEGSSQIGPDLNLPMNPTQYFQHSALLKYIRDPKSLRTWENSRMPSFSVEVLSDEDIKDIVEYLRAMAVQK